MEGMMGVREIARPFAGAVGDGGEGSAAPDDSGADAKGAGAVARSVAAGPGVDGFGHGGDAGPGPPHHRTVGSGLRRGRTQGVDIRADWGFPPALELAQQE